MWPVLFRGNVCIYSEKISNVSAILGRKCAVRLKVNQNTRSPLLSENSLRTAPLHSTLAVNNLGLKFVS